MAKKRWNNLGKRIPEPINHFDLNLGRFGISWDFMGVNGFASNRAGNGVDLMGGFVRNYAPIFVASIEAMADNPCNSARFCAFSYKLLMISLPNLNYQRHPNCVYASFNYL